MLKRSLQVIAGSLAPLTLLGAIVAFVEPGTFAIFKDWYLPLFAATMFCLGIVLDPKEFQQTIRHPRDIILGTLTQYTVMPFLGFLTAWGSGMNRSLALGFVIVGCAPGAMASNMIVYLAGGAVAFSVTLTTCSTLLSPLVTPALVKLLGGVFIPVPFWPMMKTILTTVVLPLLGGLILQRVLGRHRSVVNDWAPAIAVVSIVIIIGYAVAANQAQLRSTGPMVFGGVLFLNLAGYFLGWQLARLYRFDRRRQLALMIEIGMQNAGLGVALALQHFEPETALPGALFAVWCVISAAGATAYLRRRVAASGSN